MEPKCAVTVAMRARDVVKGENLRHAARLCTDSSSMAGVMGGRHGVLPDATKCAIGRGGRGYGAERSLKESRCQNSTGKVKRMKHIKMKGLDVIILGATRLLERAVRRVRDVEARLSKGIASPIVAEEIFLVRPGFVSPSLLQAEDMLLLSRRTTSDKTWHIVRQSEEETRSDKYVY